MKLKSKSPKKKFILITISLAIVLAAGAGAYAIYRSSQTTHQAADSAGGFQDANPLDTTNHDKQQSYEEQKKEESTTTESNDPHDDTLTVTFTSTAQIESIVRIRTEVNALIEGGTCTLTLTKDSTTVTKTVATYPTANTSTCQGFDIPVSQLSPGAWKLNLNITKDDRSGHAETTLNIS